MLLPAGQAADFVPFSDHLNNGDEFIPDPALRDPARAVERAFPCPHAGVPFPSRGMVSSLDFSIHPPWRRAPEDVTHCSA